MGYEIAEEEECEGRGVGDQDRLNTAWSGLFFRYSLPQAGKIRDEREIKNMTPKEYRFVWPIVAKWLGNCNKFT